LKNGAPQRSSVLVEVTAPVEVAGLVEIAALPGAAKSNAADFTAMWHSEF
jgi:hypothetical protein